MRQVLLYALLFLSSYSFSQVPNQGLLKIKVDGQNPRQVVELNNELTQITICDLTEGQDYSISMTNLHYLDDCAYLVSESSDMLHPIRSFTAKESCLDVWVKKSCANQSYAYFSIVPSAFSNIKGDHPEQGIIANPWSGDLTTLVQQFLIGGNCFEVSNVSFSGAGVQIGTFDNGENAIGFKDGIVMSSGNVATVSGPNSQGGAGSEVTGSGDDPDPDLAGIATSGLYDEAIIEFDFIPTQSQVTFDFVFGSEEYCEYVNAGFNDVFGFFISGPGIAGNQNIAVVPGTADPITINSINNTQNSAYFVPNSSSCGSIDNNNTEFDGFTTVLTATADIPDTCETYHIKLAIADSGDGIFDSGVFLKKGSFDAGSATYVEAVGDVQGTTVTTEGCGSAFIRFSKLEEIKAPLTVNFIVGGTATPGADYEPFLTTITIPQEVMFIDLPIDIFPDGIPEGAETIELEILDNTCSCSNPTITLTIIDPPEVNIQSLDTTVCGAADVLLDPGTPTGVAPFTYNWSTSDISPTINVTATSMPQTYTVTVTDHCGTTAEGTYTVASSPAPDATIFGYSSICNGNSTEINVAINDGGLGPWEIDLLLDGNYYGSYTLISSPTTITVNTPGDYTILSVSENGCPGTFLGTATVVVSDLTASSIVQDELCENGSDGAITVMPINSGNYTYNWYPDYGNTNQITALPAGNYDLTITDEFGCSSLESYTVNPAIPMDVVADITDVDCNNPVGGAIYLQVYGGIGPYEISWSNSATGPDNYALIAGDYEVTITDANLCPYTYTFTVGGNSDLPIATIELPSQLNCDNTQVTISGNGSSTGNGYFYQWSTTNGSIVSGSGAIDVTVDGPGTYDFVVTSPDGCVKDTFVEVFADFTDPLANATAQGDITCLSNSVSLDGAGSSTGSNISYQWTTTNGNIVSGADEINPVVNQGGTYQILVTDTNNGCTAVNQVTIQENTTSPIPSISTPDEIGCLQTQVTLNGSVTPSNADVTWSTTNGNIVSGHTSLTPTVDMAGQYSMVVTDPANGCTSQTIVDVFGDTTEPTADAGNPDELNCINTQLSLDGSGSSSGSNISYQWTTSNGNILSGPTTTNPQIDQAGDYQLLVTNLDNGCTSTASVNIGLDMSVPTVSAGNTLSITCLAPEANLNGSVMPSNASFVWSTTNGNFVSGQNSLTPVVDAAGDYLLVATDPNSGCTQSSTVTIGEDIDLPQANINNPDELNCNNLSLILDGTPSSQGNEFSYNWTTTNGNFVSGNTTLNPEIDQMGDYVLVVTNNTNGCTANANVAVTANNATPSVDAGPSGTIGCVQSTVDLSGTVSPSNSSYSWATTDGNIVSGATSLTPTVNAAGTYVLSATDPTSGCTESSSVTIDADNSIPVADAGTPNNLTCEVTTLTLDGSGSDQGSNISYQWTTSDGNIVSGASSLTPNIDQVGTYQLLVTDTDNGCNNLSTVTIVQNNETPVVDAGQADLISCLVSEVNLNGAISPANSDFVWSTTDGNFLSDQTTLNPVVNATGVYMLTATHPVTGCTESSTVVIGSNDVLPIANAGSPNELSCAIPSINLDGTSSSQGGNFSYQWTTSDGNIVSNGTTTQPTIDQPGTYVIVVTDVDNGCTASSTVDVSLNDAVPTVDAGQGGTIGCSTTQISLNGSINPIGSAFEWTTTNGNFVSGQSSLSPVVNAAGEYTIIATEPTSGCTAASTVTVDVDANTPISNAGLTAELNCYNPTITLDGSNSSQGGNYSYSWTTADGNILSGENSLSPMVDTDGVYQLVVTDNNNGCSATSSVPITINTQQPLAETGLGITLTCDVTSFILGPSTPSMNPDLSYSWTTADGNIISGSTSENPTIDASGTYNLLVVDNSNGCTAYSQIDVFENLETPSVNTGNDIELTCTATSSAINADITGTGNFEYQWTTTGGNIVSGNGTPDIIIDQPGTYQLLVLNQDNGCMGSDETVVSTNSDLPVATSLTPLDLTCDNSSVTISGTGSTTGANIVYAWSTSDGNIVSGNNDIDVVVDEPGTYVLAVTDINNNCASSNTVVIVEDLMAPTVDAGSPQTFHCGTDDLTLDGTGVGQGNNVDFLWDTQNGSIVSGNNSPNPLINSSGTYYLTVTDLTNGCVAMDSVIISQDINAPTSDAGLDAIIDCSVSNVDLGTNQTSVGTEYTYQWTASNGGVLPPVDDQPFINVGDGGTYQLVVTNTTNGCTAVSVVDIVEDMIHPIIDNQAPTKLTCQEIESLIGGPATSSGANITYQWTTQDGQIVSGDTDMQAIVNEPGTYSLTVINTDNHCETQLDFNVGQDVELPIVMAQSSQMITCTNPTVILSGAGSSVGPEFVYEWNTTNGNIINGGSSLSPEVNQAATYYLTITNADNGCQAIDSVDVDKDDSQPDAIISDPELLTCNVFEFYLDGSLSSSGNDFSYSWTTADGNILLGEDSTNPLINQPGVYQLLVTNLQNNCESFASVEVLDDLVSPNVEAGSNLTLNCNIDFILLDGSTDQSDNFTSQWSTFDGNIVADAHTFTPQVNQTGTYYLEILNLDNGCAAIDSMVVVADINAPIINITPPEVLTCTVSEIVLDGSLSSSGNEFDFSWSTTNGSILSGAKSPAPTINQKGTYTLEILNTSNGCASEKTIEVLEDIEEPTIMGSIDGLLTCIIEEVNASASASGSNNSFSYLWTTSDGVITSGFDTPNPILAMEGDYQLLVTDNINGCTATESFIVDADKVQPSALISSPDMLTCQNLQVDLTVSSDSGNQFSWTTSSGNILTGQNSDLVAVDQPGTYSVVVVNETNGCTEESSTTVLQDVEAPAVDAGPNQMLSCVDASIIIGLPNVNDDYQFVWNTTDGNIVSSNLVSTPSVSLAGNYLLVVTNTVNGCTAQDFVEVTSPPPIADIEFEVDNPTCRGNDGLASISQVSGGSAPYVYSFDGGFNFSSEPNSSYLSTGTIELIVQDALGCEYNVDVFVPEPILPEIAVDPTVEIELGDSAMLTVFTTIPNSQIDTIVWNPSEYLSCNNCLSPYAKPGFSTSYEVVITDTLGCEVSSKINVLVKEPDVYIPNAFSPNSQSIENSVFYIFGKKKYIEKVAKLIIFDRWGNQLFYNEDFLPNDPSNGWKGDFRGTDMPPGVFVYYAEIVLTNGETLEYKGDVTLIR